MNKEFLLRAINLAKENVKNNAGGPFGAVIVRNDEIIAEACNSVTTSNDCTAHAEINAIRQACKKLNTFSLEDCEIYSSCEPCPMCLSAIYWSRMKKVYYAGNCDDAAQAGFDDSFIYKELLLDKEDRSINEERHCAEEGKEPFILWNESTNKTEY
ncbi:MAG: nucleoside deaminase [Bacteroidales bacterium]|nr:nucleoside deaminase [Bacteroidales bacterium]